MERFKAMVRRRDERDDEGVPPESIWPEGFRWVVDWARYEVATGEFISGCIVPHETYAEALAEATREADDVRRLNTREVSHG